jgi:ribosome-associated protein
MLEVNESIHIPDTEFQWSFVRSGGPGGQNVNKVASKAVLRWDLQGSPSIPDEVKVRLSTLQRRRITGEGELVLSSQRYRDQARNIEDCLEKLRDMILEASRLPRPRKASRPSRGAREARLREKRHRSTAKTRRRLPADE